MYEQATQQQQHSAASCIGHQKEVPTMTTKELEALLSDF